MARFLGLDSSTQSLTAVVVDTDAGKVVLEQSVKFGKDLPQYRCANGFLENPDNRIRHSDPLMWAAALDILLERCRAQGMDWSKIAGICGSGQQHGSVYLNDRFFALRLAPEQDLAAQIKPCLSRPTSPIWMDSSTSVECAEIAQAAGGEDRVTAISGSRPIERFTGPQIRKFYKENPQAYRQTARIHLVSSFMASLLCGRDTAIDPGDGAGMNLLDLSTLKWSETLLAATAPDLAAKLPAVVKNGTAVGEIADYFVKRYGFRPGTPIFVWSGDNPCSLVGMGATSPGVAVISLGTSDTFFAAMPKPRTDPNGYGHVFGNPAGGFMCLICFTNGSLAREAVMKKVGLDYDGFARAILRETRPGNGGDMMLPYFGNETTPRLQSDAPRLFGSEEFKNWQRPAAAARAIVEAQAIAMKIYSGWIGVSPNAIRVTGGASQNEGILRVLADVFGASLVRLSVSNSASLGAALMAAQAATGKDWQELYAVFSAPIPGCVEPDMGAKAVYQKLADDFRRHLAACYGITA